MKGELAVDEESPVERYYRPTFIQKPSAETRSEEGKLVRFDVKVISFASNSFSSTGSFYTQHLAHFDEFL